MMRPGARRTRNEGRCRHIGGWCVPIMNYGNCAYYAHAVAACVVITPLAPPPARDAHDRARARRATRATRERASRQAGHAHDARSASAQAAEPGTCAATCNARRRASRRTAGAPARGSNPGGRSALSTCHSLNAHTNSVRWRRSPRACANPRGRRATAAEHAPRAGVRRRNVSTRLETCALGRAPILGHAVRPTPR